MPQRILLIDDDVSLGQMVADYLAGAGFRVAAAPTIDRARLEALRVDQMQLADQASQRITAALVEAAEVLTPAQRADLARRLERWRRG
jgi:DNA-binding response OmpR family regulator